MSCGEPTRSGTVAAGPDPAFRTFQIAPELRAKHGYPEITPALRAKVFGLNATRPYRISAEEVRKVARRDRIAQQRLAYRERPDPHYRHTDPGRGASS